MNLSRKSLLAIGLGLALVAGCNTFDSTSRTSTRTTSDGMTAAGPSAMSDNGASTKSSPKTGKAVPAGMIASRMAFPTGDEATSAVVLNKIAPVEAVAGAKFQYEIQVTNVSSLALDAVTVSESYPENLIVDGAEPRDSDTNPRTGTWMLGNLQPGQTKSIMVMGSPRAAGDITTCSKVAYESGLCLTMPVVQPALELECMGPVTASLCDAIEYRYIVRNSGSGTATGVKLSGTLPEGMTTGTGGTRIDQTIGDLAGGKSREIVLKTKVSKAGKFQPSVMAQSTNGLKTELISCATDVSAPELKLVGKAPKRAFGGRTVKYECTVTNSGTGVASNTVVRQTLPAGTPIKKLFDGKQVGNAIEWRLGDLAPNASKTLQLHATANKMGTLSTTMTADADCADEVKVGASTMVEGIAAILLEVIDEEDPIEVGSEITYLISVTNQGSADATGVKIACQIPANASYVSSSGATQAPAAAASSQAVSFTPLGKLAPQKTATWRVVVRGNSSADARFKVSMTSDQLTSPVDETEATNFYE